MQIIPLLLKEIEQEAATTRKFLKIVPVDKFGWQPHEKSMSMQVLAVHLAELFSWVKMGLETTELDFAKFNYTPTPISTTEELQGIFEKSYAEGTEALRNAKEEDLLPEWTLRNGEQVYSVWTKYEVIRHSIAQTIHHRAQIGVYLRLLNILIPGSYGPSADESF